MNETIGLLAIVAVAGLALETAYVNRLKPWLDGADELERR